MLHGTLWDKIPRFAVPVAATAILSQLFNAADIAVIGNFTGELRTVAVAAVGTNSSIISLIVNLFIGIALGANVTIAHAIGEKNDTMVHRAVHTSIVVAVLGGLIAAVIGELFAVPLLNQLNVPDDVFPLALLYLRIYLAGLPVILLYNFEAAVFRSVGETKNSADRADGLRRSERDPEPLFRGRAPHERGRRRDRNGAVERGQRGDLVGVPAQNGQGHLP